MRSTKARVSALLLAVTAGFAFANDDAAKAKEAVAQTKAAIDAELSKPLSKPLAPTVVQEASRIAGAEAPTGSNRFVERPNTGDSKLVRTAPPVVLPKGPLGKPPIDPLKAIAEGQREGGVGLDAVQREINLPGLKKDDPSLKPFVIHTRNGVNEIVRMSSKLLNRIATPFGTVYTSNLTPDAQTGLGQWTPDAFWRAMHHGRSADGRLLYPAFPYTSYTQVSRADSDALFAYLRSIPAVVQANRPHALAFPYSSQAALAVWRALFFRAGEFTPEPQQSAQWNRGAYLVRGLGHCAACHAERNFLGASSSAQALQGGVIPMQRWYAPSLASARGGR